MGRHRSRVFAGAQPGLLVAHRLRCSREPQHCLQRLYFEWPWRTEMSVQRDLFEIEVRLSELQDYSTDRWDRGRGIDNLNAPSMWEMLRTLFKLKPSKRDEVVEQARVILVVRRGWLKAYERIQWAADIVGTMQFKRPPPGLFDIPAGAAQSTEEMDANVFPQEHAAGTKSELITLKQPSMALNAIGIAPRYHMQFTEGIPSSKSINEI